MRRGRSRLRSAGVSSASCAFLIQWYHVRSVRYCGRVVGCCDTQCRFVVLWRISMFSGFCCMFYYILWGKFKEIFKVMCEVKGDSLYNFFFYLP